MASPALAQTSPKKPLTQDTYDSWRTIAAPVVSADGRWIAYTLSPVVGDGEVIVRATSGNRELRFDRGYTGRPMLTTVAANAFRAPPVQFTADSRRVLFISYAPRAEFDAARRAKKKTTPKPRLTIVDVVTGTASVIPGVASFRVANDNGKYLVYSLAKDSAAGDSARKSESSVAAAAPGGTPRPVSSDSTREPTPKKELGTPLVVRELTSGTEARIEDVDSYAVDSAGLWLAYTVSSAAPERDGAYLRKLASGATTTLLSGAGRYKGLTFDRAGKQLAFVSDRGEYARPRPRYALYYAARAGEPAREIVPANAFGADSALGSTVAFSRLGGTVRFGMAAVAPDSIPADSLADRAVYDLWTYKDQRLQPQQRVTAKEDRARTYMTLYQIASGRTVLIGNDSVPDGTLTDDGRRVLLANESPYAIPAMWGEGGSGVYVVDALTGARTLVAKRLEFDAELSTGQRYVQWFDRGAWYTYSLETGRTTNVTAAMKGVRLDQETYDQPSTPPAWGAAGWTRGDARMLVYDRFDIWELDPAGRAAPRNITDSAGVRQRIVFRIARPEERDQGRERGRGRAEQHAIDPSRPVLLATQNAETRAAGFYRLDMRARRAPERIVIADAKFGDPVKAQRADVYMVTREATAEFPNVWVGRDLAALTRVTDANPQQAQYRWPTSELVRWTSDDGIPLQGILYRPDGFDRSRKYPMVVYYYERLSDNLNSYYAPTGRNVVNPVVYASYGYLVFMPDIAYKTGYPGQSALRSVVPGVRSLVARGFVKPDAIGCAGQSWGGYETAYMVTQTDVFRACMAGAPVANMTSAYGGIRWETGLSRAFQYERTQSRIGGSLWTARDRYIENSPLFYADRVRTPLLIMSNDADGAVPWYQGIELFTALRRLGKEAYLVVYNGDAHNPVKRANQKDIDMKMLQFFGYHLQGQPAPEWMTKGIPFLQKGRDQLTPATPRIAGPPPATGAASSGAANR